MSRSLEGGVAASRLAHAEVTTVTITAIAMAGLKACATTARTGHFVLVAQTFGSARPIVTRTPARSAERESIRTRGRGHENGAAKTMALRCAGDRAAVGATLRCRAST